MKFGNRKTLEAMRSKPKRGRPKKHAEHLSIAIEVALLIKKRGDRDPAVAAVAKSLRRPHRTILNFYKMYCKEAAGDVALCRRLLKDHEVLHGSLVRAFEAWQSTREELNDAFGSTDRERIFGHLPASFSDEVARQLRAANPSAYRALVDEIRRRRFFGPK